MLLTVRKSNGGEVVAEWIEMQTGKAGDSCEHSAKREMKQSHKK